MRHPHRAGPCQPGLPGRHAPALFVVVALLIAGCCTPPPPPAASKQYVGPTDGIDLVVDRINANAARVPSLWTQLDYRAAFVDANGKTTRASGDGVLLYQRPANMVLTGAKDLAGNVFTLGCNPDEFWVKVRTAVDSADYYWGHLANVGKPCCRPVPIRPDLVSQVLGVGLLRTNFLEQPTPVMRVDNDGDGHYVFDFNVRRPDRWVTQKEVWYSRERCLPERVVLYDDAGRAVLRAELSQHQPVEAPDAVPADRRAVVARHYDLRFPDTGSTMSLDLNAPEVTHKVRRVTLPNAAAFDRQQPMYAPDPHDKVVQVDERCAE